MGAATDEVKGELGASGVIRRRRKSRRPSEDGLKIYNPTRESWREKSSVSTVPSVVSLGSLLASSSSGSGRSTPGVLAVVGDAVVAADRPPTPPTSSESVSGGSMIFKTQAESLRSSFADRHNQCRVSFAAVQVHYHETRVGDHLYCDGPPLALGEPTDTEEYLNVDDYEEQRPYVPREDSRMEPVERLEILQRQGYSLRAIMEHLEETENEYLAQQKKRGMMRSLSGCLPMYNGGVVIVNEQEIAAAASTESSSPGE